MKLTIPARIAVLIALLLPAVPPSFGFDQGADNFASATFIDETNAVSIPTDITAFTLEGTEPGHLTDGTSGAGKTVWWTWTADTTGFCTVDTRRTAFESDGVRNTVISVYTGATLGTLTRLAANDNYNRGLSNAAELLSQASFYAHEGTTYHIAVDAWSSGDVDASHYKVALQLRVLPLRKAALSSIVTSGGNNPAYLGGLTVNMTATASYSGKLNMGGKAFPFTGVFGADGLGTVTILQKAVKGALPLPPILVEMDGTGAGNLRVFLPDGSVSDFPLLRHVVSTAAEPSSVTGPYNLIMSQPPGSGGEGMLSMTVKNTGAITIAGVAKDGTPLTFSTALVKAYDSDNFGVLAYAATFAGKGGMIILAELGEYGLVDRFAGQGIYVRPVLSPPSTFYPAGISGLVSVLGSTYTKPLANKRALAFLDSLVTDGQGKLIVTNIGGELAADIDLALNLSVKNKFTFASLTLKPVLTLNPATGLVTGSITANGKKRAIKAILFANEGTTFLRGYATGTTQNLLLGVIPPP